MGHDRAEVTGLILAGGEGRRVGGADKGLLPFQGRTLAETVADRLRPQVARLLVSANRNAGMYAALGAPVLPDRREGFNGPLAGIEAGLAACTTSFMVSVPCDTPMLPRDLVGRLADALLAAGADAAVPVSGGRRQSVSVLLRRELLGRLEAFLDSGERRADGWLSTLNLCEVSFDDCADAFANLNSPEAMERFR